MATASTLMEPVRSLDRIEFQMRYMLAVWAEPLTADPGEKHFLACLRALETDPVAAARSGTPGTGPGKFAKLLRHFQQQATEMLDAALAELAGGESPDPRPATAGRPGDWAWRRWLAGKSKSFAPGPVAEAGIRLCHAALAQEMYGELAAPPGLPHKAKEQLDAVRQSAGKILEDTVRQVRSAFLTHGDMVSHLLALHATGHILAALSGDTDGAWSALESRWNKPVGEAFLILAARNEVLLKVRPNWRAETKRRGYAPEVQKIQLVPRVQRALGKLRDFSRTLVVEEGVPLVDRPVSIGEAAREEVQRFAALRSPLDPAEEIDAFARRIAAELTLCERKLYEATVAPRPVFYDHFFAWARKRFLLTSGVDFSLSDFCLYAMLHCQNALVLQKAANTRYIGLAQEGLDYSASRLDERKPLVGDMLAAFLAIEGLRRTFGATMCNNPKARWREIRPRLRDRVWKAVLELASTTPLARLLDPDVEDELFKGDYPWGPLDLLLNDPAAEVLRDYVAGTLVKTVGDRAESMRADQHVPRVLGACLKTGTLGGALLTAEFFHVLFDHLFGLWEGAFDESQPGGARGRTVEEAASAFRPWVFDGGKKPALTVYSLLVELLAVTASLEGAAADDARRLNLLRSHWSAIARCGTHGLCSRSWPRRGQRLACAFWLRFCVAAFGRFGTPPRGLRTGVARVDDFDTFTCWLVAVLRHALESHKKKSGRAAESRWWVPADAERADDRRAEADEFAWIESLVETEAVAVPQVHTALVLHGLLQRTSPDGKPKSFGWNPQRIVELAATWLK